jgi:predicted RNA binding protein YcfA (HicA-like mRNA interferase family)
MAAPMTEAPRKKPGLAGERAALRRMSARGRQLSEKKRELMMARALQKREAKKQRGLKKSIKRRAHRAELLRARRRAKPKKQKVKKKRNTKKQIRAKQATQGKTPSLTYNDLIRALKNLGFEHDRSKGHATFVKDGKSLVIPRYLNSHNQLDYILKNLAEHDLSMQQFYDAHFGVT